MFTIFAFISGILFISFQIYKITQMTLIMRGMSSLPGFPLILVIAFYILFYYTRKEERNPLKYVTFFMPKAMGIFAVSYILASIFSGPFVYLLVISLILSIIVTLYDFIQTREDSTKLESYVEGKEILPDDNIVEIEASPGDFVIGQVYKKNLNDDNEIPDGEDEYIPSGKNAVLPLSDRFLHVLVLGVTGSGKTSQVLTPMVLQDFLSDDFRFKGIDVVQMGQIILEPKGDYAKTAWAIGKLKEDEKRANYMNYLLTSEEKIDQCIQKLKGNRKAVLGGELKNGLTKEENKEYDRLKAIVKDRASFVKMDKHDQKDIQYQLMRLRSKKTGHHLTKEEENELKIIESSLKKVVYVRKHMNKVIPLDDYDKLSELSTHAMFKYASYISDITHEPGDADITWKQIKEVDPHKDRDVFMLFDPSSKKSPYFNPLYGPEDTAVGTVTSTLISFMDDSSDYFKNLSGRVLQDAIRIAKRVHGDDATLLHVNDILTNNGNRGKEMIEDKLLSLDCAAEQQAKNKDMADYFISNYYPGLEGGRGATKDYEHSTGVRNILSNLLDNEHVRRVLNPPPGVGTEINFDEILKTGDKVALSTATGASDSVGRMLGSFLILQLQEAIFRRKGKDGERVPVILYIDEFQDYASSSFESVLTRGRSYAVSSTMATQTLGIVEQKAGKGLVSNLQSNARNVILYPGNSPEDAKYFVSLFGDVEKKDINRSISQEVKEDPKGLNKIFSQISSEEGSSSAPRESISEKVTQVERFTATHIIYGPNYKNKGVGENESYGFVFYRIVIKNNVQIPAIATIKYIPESLKERADQIINAYDSVHLLELQKEQAVEDGGQDLLMKEGKAKKKRRKKKPSSTPGPDDPRSQARLAANKKQGRPASPKKKRPVDKERVNNETKNATKTKAVKTPKSSRLAIDAIDEIMDPSYEDLETLTSNEIIDPDDFLPSDNMFDTDELDDIF